MSVRVANATSATGARRRPGAGPTLLAVAALTVVGAALRLAVSHESLFADELSTYWIVTAHDLGGVLSTVHSTAEITPPLYFVLSWLFVHLGHTPELVRAPSLVAGIVSVPLVFLVGARTVGRRAALVATVLTTLSPFMIYYSAEARGYALMVALVLGSTLAMLLAADSGRRRWWVVYAVCASGAMYTHYTAAFALGAQFCWLLWAHPAARRGAVIASAGAVAGFTPWTSGLIDDLRSPTGKILSVLSPFTLDSTRVTLEHWSVGYPYSNLGLRILPGTGALVLLALALLAALIGLARARRASSARQAAPRDRRIVLVGLLAVSVPVGTALVSLVSTHLFGVRNLAASWPFLALTAGALLTVSRARASLVASALAVLAFAIGAVRMLNPAHGRPDYRGAAEFVDAHARRGDVVIDNTGILSPGPLTPLDTTLRGGSTLFRAGAPVEREHPFNVFDPVAQAQDSIHRAITAARGGSVFLVLNTFPRDTTLLAQRRAAARNLRFPSSYRLVQRRRFPGVVGLVVRVYAPRAPSEPR